MGPAPRRALFLICGDFLSSPSVTSSPCAWITTFMKVRGGFPVGTLDKEREVWRNFPSYYQIIPIGCGKGHPPSRPIHVNNVIICRSVEMHFPINTIPVSILNQYATLSEKVKQSDRDDGLSMKDPRRMAVLLNNWDNFQQSWIHGFVQGGPSCAIDSVQVICFKCRTINKKAANGGTSYGKYRRLHSGNAAGNPFAKPYATICGFPGALRRFIVA